MSPGTELIAIAAVIAVGFATTYGLLLNNLRAMLAERQLKVADQVGALDEAIRALETRLAGQAPGLDTSKPASRVDIAEASTDAAGVDDEESGEIAPEIQAAIAAATVAALGPNAVVQSVKPVPSPWSQQGRVMVQGGHNLRLRG